MHSPQTESNGEASIEAPTSANDGAPRYIRASEAARKLGYAYPRTVRELIRSGQIPATLVPGTNEYQIDERVLKDFRPRPRGRPRRISDETWRKIEQDIQSGQVSQREAAEQAGISVATIHRHMQDLRRTRGSDETSQGG